MNVGTNMLLMLTFFHLLLVVDRHIFPTFCNERFSSHSKLDNTNNVFQVYESSSPLKTGTSRINGLTIYNNILCFDPAVDGLFAKVDMGTTNNRFILNFFSDSLGSEFCVFLVCLKGVSKKFKQ